MLKRNIFLDCDMQNLLQFEGIYGPIGYRKKYYVFYNNILYKGTVGQGPKYGFDKRAFPKQLTSCVP